MAADDDVDSLRKIFAGLDIDRSGTLDATEITKAFQKAGEAPALTEVYAYIDAVDSTGTRTINFDDFCVMMAKVRSGELPSATGLTALCKSAMEDYIANVNKPVEKNTVVARTGGRGRGEAKAEAPQGEKYGLQKGRGKKVRYGKGLPGKKSLDDLP